MREFLKICRRFSEKKYYLQTGGKWRYYSKPDSFYTGCAVPVVERQFCRLRRMMSHWFVRVDGMCEIGALSVFRLHSQSRLFSANWTWRPGALGRRHASSRKTLTALSRRRGLALRCQRWSAIDRRRNTVASTSFTSRSHHFTSH